MEKYFSDILLPRCCCLIRIYCVSVKGEWESVKGKFISNKPFFAIFYFFAEKNKEKPVEDKSTYYIASTEYEITVRIKKSYESSDKFR